MFNTRVLVGAIASFGVIETAYLTGAELLGKAEEICPTLGCQEVLASPYSQVFGIPLTLFGLFAYTAVALLAFYPQLKGQQSSKVTAETTWLWLLGITTVMVISSSYLMYVMLFKVQAICPYCVVSASLSLTLWLLCLIGHRWSHWRPVLITALITAILTFTGVWGVYADVEYQSPTAAVKQTETTEGQEAPTITNASGTAEIALAQHLQATGAKMYSSFTCPHCYQQKQLFGQEAFRSVPHVECHPQGKNSQTQLCSDAGITGVPTWEISGQFFPGVQPLEKLAELSGYQGNQDFIHPFPY